MGATSEQGSDASDDIGDSAARGGPKIGGDNLGDPASEQKLREKNFELILGALTEFQLPVRKA